MPTNDSTSKNEKSANQRAEFLDTLRRVFDTPDGNLVLAWLHATAGTRKPAFLPGDRDPYAAASRDGRKSIVWEIETNLDAARASRGSDTGDKPPTAGAPRARRQGS